MSEQTILVIDDSTTIRRLVDGELSAAGYRVLMAATAEDGLRMASEDSPDLILLDHQLPGVTGYEVCCQLFESPLTKNIPVVCSSTLRKKAYAEYTELDNVIDMLPKPYTPELLRTIVANALETAAMIVSSQAGGTAVPEVINEMAEGELGGNFDCFTIREVIDFLNNGHKQGVLEVDLGRSRVAIHLKEGRIQAVTASGIEQDLITGDLPLTIRDLAPMVKFTIRGKKCSEVDGLVELLDNKVLDSRLLKQLLRHQAAVLLNHCLNQKPMQFRFDTKQVLPSLFQKLPLDVSLLALMVDSSVLETPHEVSETEANHIAYVRNPQRGQNLDRGGLGAGHMQILNFIASPMTVSELSLRSNLQPNEIQAVLNGFVRSELVTRREKQQTTTVFAVTGNVENARRLNEAFRGAKDSLSGKVVRDLLAVKLMLRRVRPDVLLIDMDCEKARQTLSQLHAACPSELSETTWLGVAEDTTPLISDGQQVQHFHDWSDDDSQLVEWLQESHGQTAQVV